MFEWVDVTDKKWTDHMKKMIITIRIIQISLFTLYCIGIAEILKIIVPYVSDPEMVLEHALTNSQITAMALISVLAFSLKPVSKMIFLR